MKVIPAASNEVLQASTQTKGRSFARGRGRFSKRWCTNCCRDNHDSEEYWSKKRSRETDESKSPDNGCWHCGEMGHNQRDCSVKRRGEEMRKMYKRARVDQEGLSTTASNANTAKTSPDGF